MRKAAMQLECTISACSFTQHKSAESIWQVNIAACQHVLIVLKVLMYPWNWSHFRALLEEVMAICLKDKHYIMLKQPKKKR